MKQQVDLQKLNKEELIELKNELTKDVQNISYQIMMAKVDKATYGRKSDPSWFKKANFALIKKRETLMDINLCLSRLKNKRDRSLQSNFIEAARDLLSQEEYQEILDQAHKLMGD